MREIRGFQAVFTAIGVLYVLLASSMLVRGVAVMRDFAVSDAIVRSPVFEDFFLFFYQLMAAYGVLMILFAHITKGRASQLLVSAAFCVLNILIALRDLSTSDSALGNHLYRGSGTLIPVYLDLAFALAFGVLASRWRSPPARSAPTSPP